MVFLSLIAVGALAGILFEWSRRAGAESLDAAHRGMAGSFLAGGFAVGMAERPVGAFDPIVLAVGAVGAVAFVVLLRIVERPGAGKGGDADRAPRHTRNRGAA